MNDHKKILQTIMNREEECNKGKIDVEQTEIKKISKKGKIQKEGRQQLIL